MTENAQKLDNIRQRLADLDAERIKLELQKAELEKIEADTSSEVSAQIIMSAGEKIELFSSLFLGRTDVFPIRWENAKTSKSGYAIACGNEWIKGLCNKPRVKCSACESKAFLPVTDDIIRFHLSGRNARQQPFCVGVYPMLPDETCHFLVVRSKQMSPFAANSLSFVSNVKTTSKVLFSRGF